MRGRALAPGAAAGNALVLREPLSLWGGIDPASGIVVDARHPQRGESVSGRVLVMSAVRVGSAPAAILLGEVDLILAVGAAVAEELYGRRVPVVLVPPAELAGIVDGAPVRVEGAEVVVG